MQGDDIGPPQKLLQCDRLDSGGNHYLWIDIWVAGDDRQVERFGARCDCLSDAAEPDDAKGLLAQRLDGTTQDAPGRWTVLDPGALAQRAILFDDAAVEGQDHGQGVV